MIKKQSSYEDDKISIGYRILSKHVTTEALEALGASLNFIEIWIELLDNNYDAICVAYSTDMKEMFKKIPTTVTKSLNLRKKVQKL